MERHGEEVDLSTNEARGGSTPHIVRYVLLISLFLAAAAMTIVWVTGALSSSDDEPADVVSGQDIPGDAGAAVGDNDSVEVMGDGFTYDERDNADGAQQTEGLEGLTEVPDRSTGAE